MRAYLLLCIRYTVNEVSCCRRKGSGEWIKRGEICSETTAAAAAAVLTPSHDEPSGYGAKLKKKTHAYIHADRPFRPFVDYRAGPSRVL